MEEEDDSLAAFAYQLIDDVLTASVRKMQDINEGLANVPNLDTTVVSVVDIEDYQIRNIDWCLLQDFTIDHGYKQIEEFVKTWELSECWMFCIDFLSTTEHDYDTRYKYRVRFSIPTRRKPVPRATVCAYFTVSVAKFKPKDLATVGVNFVVETQRLVHQPGKTRFREKWLKDVLDNKIRLFDQLTF